MSLRARLTLLYTTLLGGILLLFGVTVYLFVGFLLTNQVDENLIQTFEDIRTNTRFESVGNIEVLRLPSLDLTGNVYAQAWDRSGQLRSSNVPDLKQPSIR
jgi:hypothetical protein